MNVRTLVVTSAVAIVSYAAVALAADTDSTGPATLTALATNSQNAAIILGSGTPTRGSNSAFDISASGLVNFQQNTGINSILQDANALSAILDCDCAHATDLATASRSTQTALILGDITVRTPNGAGTGLLGQPANHIQSANNSVESTSNSITGFAGGSGIFNISQNTGTNSVLQSTNTVAEIRGNAQGSTSSLLSH